MKKIITLFAATLLFYSCLNTDNDSFSIGYELLPIDSYTTPNSFTFGEKDTIKIKYTLKNKCYNFDNIYYEYQDTARIVAVRSIVELDKDCEEVETQNEYNLIVTATQKEDYLFKFYKGRDNDGKNVFAEVIVPVN